MIKDAIIKIKGRRLDLWWGLCRYERNHEEIIAAYAECRFPGVSAHKECPCGTWQMKNAGQACDARSCNAGRVPACGYLKLSNWRRQCTQFQHFHNLCPLRCCSRWYESSKNDGNRAAIIQMRCSWLSEALCQHPAKPGNVSKLFRRPVCFFAQKYHVVVHEICRWSEKELILKLYF